MTEELIARGRNLTPSQRAALALELKKQLAAEAKQRRAATLKQNQSTDRIILSEREQGRARDKATEMTGASPAYIQQAKQIAKDAPEIFDHVKQGKLSIPQAKKVAALPVAERPAAIERVRKKEPEEGGYIYQDGKLVEVQTNKEVSQWLRRLSRVLEAIETLGTVDVTPEEYLREFQPESAYRIDEHLSAATR